MPVMQNMTPARKRGSVTGSLRGLFGADKRPNVTFERRPDDYYGMVWVDKPVYEAIDFLAIANHTTRKKLVHDLLTLGISQRGNVVTTVEHNNKT